MQLIKVSKIEINGQVTFDTAVVESSQAFSGLNDPNDLGEIVNTFVSEQMPRPECVKFEVNKQSTNIPLGDQILPAEALFGYDGAFFVTEEVYDPGTATQEIQQHRFYVLES
jgi:hypothetical protein